MPVEQVYKASCPVGRITLQGAADSGRVNHSVDAASMPVVVTSERRYPHLIVFERLTCSRHPLHFAEVEPSICGAYFDDFRRERPKGLVGRIPHELGWHKDRICGSEAVGEILLLRNSPVSAVTFGYC